MRVGEQISVLTDLRYGMGKVTFVQRRYIGLDSSSPWRYPTHFALFQDLRYA